MEQDKSKFNKDMLDIYYKCKKIGYAPARFYKMVVDMGGFEAARQLIAKEDGSSGFTELWMRNKIEWSMEALIIEKWPHLFTIDERRICEERLAKVSYKPKVL